MNDMAICSYCGELCEPVVHTCPGDKVFDSTPADAVFKEPVYRWEIIIGGHMGIMCKFETDPPNRLQTFMYKFLLGWIVKVL